MKKGLILFLLVAFVACTNVIQVNHAKRQSKLTTTPISTFKFDFRGSCQQFFNQKIAINGYSPNGCLPISGVEDLGNLNAEMQCLNILENRAIITVLRVFTQDDRDYNDPYIVSIHPTKPIRSSARVYLRRPNCKIATGVCSKSPSLVVSSCEDNPPVIEQRGFYVVSDDTIYFQSTTSKNVTTCFVNNERGVCCSYIDPSNGICPRNATNTKLLKYLPDAKYNFYLGDDDFGAPRNTPQTSSRPHTGNKHQFKPSEKKVPVATYKKNAPTSTKWDEADNQGVNKSTAVKEQPKSIKTFLKSSPREEEEEEEEDEEEVNVKRVVGLGRNN